jgi:transcriptional regulator of acetoin/glycerol metabolism
VAVRSGTVHEVTDRDGVPTIVSDFIEGLTLRELLEARRLTFREAAELVAQVTEALDYARSLKVVHRDIKPANIMIQFGPGVHRDVPLDQPKASSAHSASSWGESGSANASGRSSRPRALLLDFGLALRDEAEVTLTADGQIIGTPAYASADAARILALSPRRERTFVKLNCAAIPTGLLESELFGHEKGAFTGAISQKIGRFELAHQGTLFLDEIGDIPLELQPKLLRALQEQEFERLGSTRTVRVDVRLVAATNCDLARMVADGLFRSDLYYRLNVFPVLLPPLRDRRDDIPMLTRHFTQQFARRMSRQIEHIPQHVMDALVRYSWPGNVRELQNVIERAVILSQGLALQISPGDLKSATAPLESPAATPVTLADAERDHILSALKEAGWVVGGPNGAASRLGMKRSTLQWTIKKLAISRPE